MSQSPLYETTHDYGPEDTARGANQAAPPEKHGYLGSPPQLSRPMMLYNRGNLGLWVHIQAILSSRK